MAAAPSQHDVALRALCLTALATAGAYSAVLAAEPDAADDVEEAALDLAEWVEEDGLAGALSAGERALLALPLDEWSDAQRLAAASRGEALGVLLWALAVADELPPWDEPFAAVDLAPLGATVEELLDESALRPGDELERARDVAELWRWRACAAAADADVVGGTARAALDAGDLPELLGGDFPALGRPYRELDGEEAALLRTIAEERSNALAWLCGQGGDWDVPGPAAGV